MKMGVNVIWLSIIPQIPLKKHNVIGLSNYSNG
jgi:hypothetical protein